MREVIYIQVNGKRFVVDPVLDALNDIAKGDLHICKHGTGIEGYMSFTLDEGNTKELDGFPTKVASGHAHCTAFPDPPMTSNDYEYMLQYNQTILHHLDSTRVKTSKYNKKDFKVNAGLEVRRAETEREEEEFYIELARDEAEYYKNKDNKN